MSYLLFFVKVFFGLIGVLVYWVSFFFFITQMVLVLRFDYLVKGFIDLGKLNI